MPLRHAREGSPGIVQSEEEGVTAQFPIRQGLLPLPPVPQVELQPVSMKGSPLDVSLTSRWPLLTRLSLHMTIGSTVEAVLTSSGAEVTLENMPAGPADTHGQLQGLLDGFIRPRWGRQPPPSSPRSLRPGW